MLLTTPFQIGDYEIAPGTRETVDLPVSVLSDHTPMSMSVHVIHGKKPGPTLFVSGAVHGDEIIGVEIIRRLLRTKSLKRINGTLLAVPIVNSFGFMNHSRYLPDRRDLNRSFPGSVTGSLAARLANLFMTEVVEKSDVGIDIHSAAIHRANLPQIRVSGQSKKSIELAEAFAAPMIIRSPIREGSLRSIAAERDISILVYEAGEGLRFDEFAVRLGVTGILNVMRHMEILPKSKGTKKKAAPITSHSSHWERAPLGGILRAFKGIGDEVKEGDVLGAIADPFGEVEVEIVPQSGGVIIGRNRLPIVNEGDAIFHIAKVRRKDNPEEIIDTMSAEVEDDPIFDEDEII